MTLRILQGQRKRVFELYKKTLSCCVCGYDDDSSVLEFHHIRPNDKVASVGELVNTGFYEIILDEISKCAVICFNCHAIIHRSLNTEKVEKTLQSLVAADTAEFIRLCNLLNILLDYEEEVEIEEDVAKLNPPTLEER